MDPHAVETPKRTANTGWRTLLTVIVVAVGLLCGAVLGLFGAFSLGLLQIRC